MATAAELAVVITSDTKGLEKGLDSAKKGLGGLGDVAGKAGLAMGAGFAAAGVAVAGAAAVVGKAWFDAASDAGQSVDDLQAKLGISAEAAQHLGDIGMEVFKNNWGESIGDATDAVGQFTKAFDFDIPKDQLQTVVEQGFAVQQAFDFPIEEQSRALSVLSANFTDVAADGTKALDMVTQLMQTGDANADDLLETIGEYSPLFDQLGFTSEEFFGILQSGLAAGARDTDFVADLFKEFGIRIADGSKSTQEALDALNLGHITEQLRTGAIDGSDAWAMVHDAIAAIEDPIKKNELGVALMGTKFEDLGQEVVDALSTEPMRDFEGAALEAGDNMNRNLGSAFESLKRNALAALMGIEGEYTFEDLESMGVEAIGKLSDFIVGAIETIGPVIADVVTRVMDFVTALQTAGDWSSSFGETIATATEILLGLDSGALAPVGEAIDAFLAGAQTAFDTVMGVFEDLSGSAEDNFGSIQDIVGEVVGWFKQHVAPTLDVVVERWKANIDRLVAFWDEWGGTIIGVVMGAVRIVWPILEGLFALIKGGVEIVLAIFRGDWATAWESAKSTVATVASSIGESLAAIWDVITEIAGTALEKAKEIGLNIIDGLIQGIADTVGDVKDAVVGAVSDAVDAGKNFLGIRSPSRVFQEMGEFMIEGLARGLSRSRSIVSAAKDMAKSVVETVEEELGIASPSRVFEGIGANAVAGLAVGLEPMADAAKEAAEEMIGSMPTEVPEITIPPIDFGPIDELVEVVEELPSHFAPVVDALEDAADEIVDAMSTMAADVDDSGGETGRSALQVAANFADMAAGIKLAVSIAAPAIGALLVAIGPVGWAIGAVAVAVGVMVVAWRNNWGDIQGKTAAVVDWLKGVPATVAGIWNGVKQGLADLRATWLGKWEEIKAAVLEIDWGRLAIDILTGIAAGFAGSHGILINAARDAAASAWDAMTGFWEARSPSRLAARLGHWIMEGLALGIGAGGVTARQALDMSMDELRAALADTSLDEWRAEYERLGGEIREIMLSFLTPEQADEVAGLIDEGQLDRAMVIWGRYYDDLKAAEQARHDEYIANIEAENEANADLLDMAVRRIEALQAMVGDGGEISGFSNEVDRVEATFSDLLASIGFTGSKALDDFFSMWTDGAVDAIMNSDHLLEAIDALSTYAEDAADARIDEENERHRLVMEHWDMQESTMRRLLEDQGYAEERINDLIAYREELYKAAEAAIKRMQEAAEAYEERVHEQVMAHLEELMDEREAAHEANMAALEAERDAILAVFEAMETEIDHLKVDLAELRFDLDLEGEIEKLGYLQDGLARVREIISSINVIGLDPIGQNAAERKRQTDSIRLETDAQRQLIRQAIASGDLDERQMFVAERLMLGYKFNAEEVMAIFGMVEQDMVDRVGRQQLVVDGIEDEIEALEDLIEIRELALTVERDRNVEVLAGLNAAIDLEKQRWEDEREHIEDLMARENARHEQRMADIAAEWALELARLGMSEDEIQAMINEAIRVSRAIADEAMAIYRGLIDGVRDMFASAPPIELPPVVLPPGGPILPPGVPPPDPGDPITPGLLGDMGVLSLSAGGTSASSGGITLDLDIHPVVTMEPIEQHITVSTRVDGDLLDTAFERRTERLERAIRFGRGSGP